MTTKQKTVVVTGASQGIGAAVANLFLERGYNVVANSRNISRTTGLQRSDRLALVDGDIALATTAETILSTALGLFGSLDALVNNAGIFFPKPFTEYTPEDFRALSSTNLEGFIYTTQLAMKQSLTQPCNGVREAGYPRKRRGTWGCGYAPAQGRSERLPAHPVTAWADSRRP